MDEISFITRVKELERTIRILEKKVARCENNRMMLEEILDTHSNALKARNAELEESQARLRESETRYRNLAHHDPLTGLLNRTYFQEHLIHAIAHAKREQTFLAVLFMDLDRFKPINDTYGHTAGDNILIQIAERLTTCVRADDILARFGGDEFIILLGNLDDCDLVNIIIDRIISTMSKPFFILDNSFTINVSIGISLYPIDEVNPEMLISKADFAMYINKKKNSGGYCFYKDLNQGEGSL